jgi:hypothetical protein
MPRTQDTFAMTQKHKDSDLEQVKSLLRRLDDIPESQPTTSLSGPQPGKAPAPQKLALNASTNVVGIPPALPRSTVALDAPPITRRQEPVLPHPKRETLAPPHGQSRPQPASTQGANPVRGRRLGLLVVTALIAGGSTATILVWPALVPQILAATGLSKSVVKTVRSETRARDVQPATVGATERTIEPAVRMPPPPSPSPPSKVEASAPAAEASAAVSPNSQITALSTAVPAAFEAPPNAAISVSAPPTATAAAVLPEQARANSAVGSQPSASSPAEAGRQSAPSVALAHVAPPPVKRNVLPDAESQDEDLQRKLVLQGQQMLTQGHVASARLLFRRAADTGSAEAAILLGDTFDPQRLYALGVRGVAGDLQQSIRWYEKADELGASDAKERLMSIAGR